MKLTTILFYSIFIPSILITIVFPAYVFITTLGLNRSNLGWGGIILFFELIFWIVLTLIYVPTALYAKKKEKLILLILPTIAMLILSLILLIQWNAIS